MKFYKHLVSEFYGGPADGRVIRLHHIFGVSDYVVIHGHGYRLFCKLPDRNVYLSSSDPTVTAMWAHHSDPCVLYTMWRDSSDTVLYRGSEALDKSRHAFLECMAKIIERRQKAKRRT